MENLGPPGAQNGPKMAQNRAQNGPKWPFLAILDPPKWHISARGFLIMGYPAAFFPINPLPRAPKMRRKVAKNGHFLAKNGPKWAIFGHFGHFLVQNMARFGRFWPVLASFWPTLAKKSADLASRLAGRLAGWLAGWAWGPPGAPNGHFGLGPPGAQIWTPRRQGL